MKYTRRWTQDVVYWKRIAPRCQAFTDDGWTVHTIIPTDGVCATHPSGGIPCSSGCGRGDGAIIVAYKDEPDLTGGVPR